MADNDIKIVEDNTDDFEEMMRSLDALKAQEEEDSQPDNRDGLLTKSIEDFTDDDIDALLNLVENSTNAKIFSEDDKEAEAGPLMSEPELEMPEAEAEPLMFEPELEMPVAEAEPPMSEPELEMPEAEVEPLMSEFESEMPEAEPLMSEPESEPLIPEPELTETEPDGEGEEVKVKRSFNILDKLKRLIPLKRLKNAKMQKDEAGEANPPEPTDSGDELKTLISGIESENDQVLSSLLSKVPTVDNIDWTNNGDDFFKSNTVYDGPESLLKRDEPEQVEATAGEDETKKEAEEEKQERTGLLHKLLGSKLDKVTEKTNLIPTPILLACVGVLFVLTVVMGILIIIQKGKVDELRAASVPTYDTVEIPSISSHSSNYIFVNQQRDFRDDSLLLTKFSMDEIGTFFYFDKYIPVGELDIVLRDGKGEVYCLDTIFAAGTGEGEPTVIKFQPFATNVGAMVLRIYDPDSQQTTEFSVRIQGSAEAMPKRFINEQVLLQDSDDSIGITIERGSFGTAGSQMQYKLSWESLNTELAVVPINGDIKNNFEIYSNGSKLFMTRTPTEAYYPDERAIVGNIEFYPLRSLAGAGTLRFKLKNIYRSMNKATMVDIPKLLMDDPENQQIINIATSKVVLERMGKFADIIALVYHAESFHIADPSTEGEDDGEERSEADPLSNFTEAILDCDLIITREDGVEIIVPGDCRSKQEGGDVRFFLSGVEGMPDTLLPTQVAVRINSIMLKMPDVETSISVGTLPTRPDKSELHRASAGIETGFENRLMLKEGKTDTAALVRNRYFSEEVLNDRQLAKNYTAEELTGKTARSAYVMAITQSHIDVDLFYATVEELWIGGTPGGEKHFRRTHEVTARRSGDSYTIIGDKIIN